MARYGKIPVKIPEKVNVTVEGRLIKVKGPKGELSWEHPEGVNVVVDNGEVRVKINDERNKQLLAYQGLTRSLINNMVKGVTEGFVKELYLVGTIYNAQMRGRKLVMSLGYSHPVEYEPPQGIELEVEPAQFSINNQKVMIIRVKGIDKQLVGQVAAIIRGFREPDNYKGKGIRYSDERLILKEGKKSKK